MKDAATFYGEAERRGASDGVPPAVDRRMQAVVDVIANLSCHGVFGAIEILNCSLMFAKAALDVGVAMPDNAFTSWTMDTNRN